MLSTELIRCSKCKFSFHNNAQIDTCPRCGVKLNPNLQQGGISSNSRSNKVTSSSSKEHDNLEKILSFPYAIITDIGSDYHNTIPNKKIAQASINKDRNEALRNLTRILAFGSKVNNN